ncbi:MAG: rhomboid family intramembrane serine protease [gamma proteobacterium symbiont of Bathyaustriella thionipta]|nr:rhomboid family intramembrane serine protease [gamma proteobacterium symbiont of Bathyaustriella thionipta]
MLLIPHSADLDLGRHPWATWGVMFVCLLIFLAQDNNSRTIEQHAANYCYAAYNPQQARRHKDFMRLYRDQCMVVLIAMHNSDAETMPWLLSKDMSLQEQGDAVLAMKKHYYKFQLHVPPSLSKKLMYRPDSWNPFTMISAALAHGSWLHLIGNLIFFMAFASAVEIIIASTWRYLLTLTSIAMITHISYSIVTSLSTAPVPTLGLSGVVLGVIGLSAFLMPHARIRTFFWFFVIVRNIRIRAWILALWFIGLDIWSLWDEGMGGGVNLVAHVSGGISGYLIGYFFFRTRREEIQEELDDEIAAKQVQRGAPVAIKGNLGLVTSHQMINQQRQQQSRKDHARFMDQLSQEVRVGDDSRAVLTLLQDFDTCRNSPDVYEAMFAEMYEWKKCRALLCLGRLTITLLLQQKLDARALHILQQCQKVSGQCVLGALIQTERMVQIAIENNQYKSAWLLVTDIEKRYRALPDPVRYQLLEAEILWRYLHNKKAALELLRRVLAREHNPHRQETLRLVHTITHSNPELTLEG